MLKKIASLTGTATLVLTALSCMQTAEAAGKFAWQKDVVCKRSTVATPINITTENMSSSVNNGKGCFNGPNKNCNIRMYQIMVESYIHGEGGAMGYGYAWGPSQHDGNLKGIIENLLRIRITNYISWTVQATLPPTISRLIRSSAPWRSLRIWLTRLTLSV